MARYRCPECKVEADIDQEKKAKKIILHERVSFPKAGHTCELAKAISQIDFSKLERL